MPTNLIAAALALQKQGRLLEAEALYLKVLRAQPRNFDVLHFSGILKLQLGLPDEGVKLLRAALKIRPAAAEAHLNLGLAQQSLGRHADALASFERAGALRADYAEALFNRGNALQSLQRLDEALASYDKALATRSAYPEALSNRGNLLRTLGRNQQALEDYDRALVLAPGFPEVLNNRGIALRELGRLGDALECFDAALARMPHYPEALYNRGNALLGLGRAGEGLDSFDRALALRPEFAECLYNKANALRNLKRIEEALVCFDLALSLRPRYVEARNNRGAALADLGLYELALDNYDVALAAWPDSAELHNNRGNVLAKLQRLPEAVADFQRVCDLSPGYDCALGKLVHYKMFCCDWHGLGELVQRIGADVRAGKRSVAPFELTTVSDAPQDLLPCARTHVGHKFPAAAPLWQGERYGHARIRVAYLSDDFREHAAAHLMAGMMEQHDRSRFEVIGVSFSPDEPSPIRARLEGAFERFIDVSRKSDLEVALLLRELEVDIAVDLMWHLGNARTGIFALRPAPVQVNMFGLGSFGAEYIDYIIADETVLPAEHFEYYMERVVWLPDTLQPNDAKRAIAERIPTRAEAGLPERGFVFCAFNNSYKFTPKVFDVWMRLLGKTENSVLWLQKSHPVAVNNLRREAAARGVDPARLVFAERTERLEDHLARYRLADIFLDTLPYNAQTTASDALWAGVPVLTCLGQTFAGRIAASLLKAVGLPELITHTLPEYEDLAMTLAGDPASLGRLRARLAQNRLTSALFDATRFTRHLESAYTEMCERQRRNEPPKAIVVKPMPRRDGTADAPPISCN